MRHEICSDIMEPNITQQLAPDKAEGKKRENVESRTKIKRINLRYIST